MYCKCIQGCWENSGLFWWTLNPKQNTQKRHSRGSTEKTGRSWRNAVTSPGMAAATRGMEQLLKSCKRMRPWRHLNIRLLVFRTVKITLCCKQHHLRSFDTGCPGKIRSHHASKAHHNSSFWGPFIYIVYHRNFSHTYCGLWLHLSPLLREFKEMPKGQNSMDLLGNQAASPPLSSTQRLGSRVGNFVFQSSQ